MAGLGLEERFLAALRSVLPQDSSIALHEPEFAGNEWAYVKACIDTGWVSSAGSYVREFERQLEDFTGSKHAVATVNGTAALHVALKLAGVAPGDEVLVPALSFVATANAVSYCDAIPHFVDSEAATLGMDPDALRDYLAIATESTATGIRNKATGRRVAAVVPMHAFGHPVRMEELLRVSHDARVALVEDAAESLGSFYADSHTGTLGRLGALSFNGNKIVTTGGGGAILTQDEALARHAKHLTTTAKSDHRWDYRHDETGWNYRLPNINAALGCAQLERLPDMLARKRQLASRYRKAMAPLDELEFVNEPARCRSNFWLNAVLLREPSETIRDRLLAATNDAGVMTRPAWALLNTLPMYADCPRAPLPVAERLHASIVNVPSSAGLVRGEAR